MPGPADVTINRTAVTAMAYYGDVNLLCNLWKEVRATIRRLQMAQFDSPTYTLQVLTLVDPGGTYPSMLDIIAWLTSLNHTSDSDSELNSTDAKISELKFACRLYSTLDARVPPAYKAAIIAQGL